MMTRMMMMLMMMMRRKKIPVDCGSSSRPFLKNSVQKFLLHPWKILVQLFCLLSKFYWSFTETKLSATSRICCSIFTLVLVGRPSIPRTVTLLFMSCCVPNYRSIRLLSMTCREWFLWLFLWSSFYNICCRCAACISFPGLYVCCVLLCALLVTLIEDYLSVLTFLLTY